MFEGQVADFVDDDQPVAAEPGELGWQFAEAVGFGESGDPVDGGGEQDPVAVVCGDHAEAGGEVGFAGAGRAEQHDVAGLGREPAGGKRGDLLTDGGLVVPVEVVEGLAGREPGPTDALRGAGRVRGRRLRVRARRRGSPHVSSRHHVLGRRAGQRLR